MLSAIKHGSKTVRVYSDPRDAHAQLDKIATPEMQRLFNLKVKEVNEQHMDVCVKYTVLYNKDDHTYIIQGIRGYFSQSRRWPARVYNEMFPDKQARIALFQVAAYSHEEAIQLTKDYVNANHK